MYAEDSRTAEEKLQDGLACLKGTIASNVCSCY